MTGYTLEVTARSILTPSISRQSLKANICNPEGGFKTPSQRTCQQPHRRPLKGHVRLPAMERLGRSCLGVLYRASPTSAQIYLDARGMPTNRPAQSGGSSWRYCAATRHSARPSAGETQARKHQPAVPWSAMVSPLGGLPMTAEETKEAGAKVGYIVPPPAQKRKNGVPIKSSALTSSLTLSSASLRVSGFPFPLLGPKQSQLPRRDLSAKKYKPSAPPLATICQSGATSSLHGPLRQNPPTREESCGHATPSFTHPTV